MGQRSKHAKLTYADELWVAERTIRFQPAGCAKGDEDEDETDGGEADCGEPRAILHRHDSRVVNTQHTVHA